MVGIDEAGRGPVIGDMVLAGIAIDERAIDILSRAGVRDSKKLEPSQRERLLGLILSECIAVSILRVPPSVIDSENLNKVFARGCARILRNLYTVLSKEVKSCNAIEVYIDACGNPKKLEALIRSYLGTSIASRMQLHLEHGADAKYVPVAAASIVAKVVRDKHIESLKRVYGDFGSGYPSDPRTIEWLRRTILQGCIPPIVRRSWETVKRILRERSTLLKYAKR